ncbi:MAG TPA: PAS domain S-box protein, partial [Pseudomonadales bacterium]|nr:PAS domain S-box protein [Pseudomonadales bacterium]
MSEKQKILIVDDKKENLFTLEVTLRESNVQVIQASSGNEALRLSLSHDFALAILDVQMPIMSGYELAEYLRGDSKTKHIPIIFLTAALIQEIDIFKGYESGGVDYIVKPYNPAFLISKVNVFLELDYDKRELSKKQEYIEAVNRDLKALNDRVSLELRWYEDIVSTSTDFLLFIDTEYICRAVNTSYLNFFEISREGVIGKTTGEVQGEILFKGLTKERIKECLSGNYIQFQEWIESHTGEPRCLDVHLEPFVERDGLTSGVVVNGRDISDRKHAELELMRSEEKFRLVVESASDGMMFVNEDGEITLVNKQLELMTGYSRKELIGQPMEKLIPDRINEHKQLRDDYISKPHLRPMGIGRELIAQRKDGSEVLVEISLNPVETEEGLLISAVIVDITERKRADDALRLDATTFETHEGIIITDKDGNVLRVNGAFSEITGFCEEEVIGKPPRILQSQHDEAEFYQQIQADLLELGRWEGETYSKRKNGETYIIWLNVTAVKDEKGKVTNHVAHFSDISEFKEQQSIINQAQKMEAVGQLTGGIAHDFNNLLSIISGNLRFLKHDVGEVSNYINELFEDAISATSDGIELTQQLLGFSRTRKLEAEPIDVNDAIDESIRLLSRTLAKNIELKTDLTNKKLFICVDPSQLENALLNLCINARDAMPDGGKITISTEHYYQSDSGGGQGDGFSLGLPEGNYVKILVTDTGSGISPENMQHVFEPFFTTKDVGKGSGLGLSMVFGFSHQSNGECHIDSTPGEGTTVSMYFPEFIERRVADRRPKDAKERQEIVLHGSEVILVVENEPRVRRVALRDLRVLGYKILEAENAHMAKTII